MSQLEELADVLCFELQQDGVEGVDTPIVLEALRRGGLTLREAPPQTPLAAAHPVGEWYQIEGAPA